MHKAPIADFPDFLKYLEALGRADFPEDVSDGAEAIASEVKVSRALGVGRDPDPEGTGVVGAPGGGAARPATKLTLAALSWL